MKNDIILSGVGGQGILSIAATIGLAAVANNIFLKQSEVHGMSQRGGDVQSHLRLVTNSNPFINIPDYPSLNEILKEIGKIENHIIIDADGIAKEAGSARSGNIVILGAASPYIDMPFESLENAIKKLFGRKGNQIVESNLKALRAGRECSIK